jgi:hypothetical protein
MKRSIKYDIHIFLKKISYSLKLSTQQNGLLNNSYSEKRNRDVRGGSVRAFLVVNEKMYVSQ